MPQGCGGADGKKILSGKRILIVDDNATNRKVLELQARSFGMLPLVTCSGPEALECVRRGEAVDLALLDMKMPEMDGVQLGREIRKLRSKDELPLVLLTSHTHRLNQGEGEGGETFSAYLTKPVKPKRLREVLANLFTPEIGATSSSPLDEHGERAESQRPLRILIAEDNPVNQKVASRLLERLGYRAEVVGDGLEVLTAIKQKIYDVIFMDVQMPEMGGLEATQRIRQVLGSNRPPRIIAMTARAMQGDKEECLAAGMDDYVTKPVRIEDLRAVIQRCVSSLSPVSSGFTTPS
jgi:CheY-like chemotaxis protein